MAFFARPLFSAATGCFTAKTRGSHEARSLEYSQHANTMLPTILLSQPSFVNAGRRERGSIRMPAVFAVEGCTDATMINYNMHATIDNGSCFPATVGCLDRNAQNFNCTLPGEGVLSGSGL